MLSQSDVFSRALLGLCLALGIAHAFAQQDHPSTTGQTGLVNMPDARFAPVGSWRTGISWMRPYEAFWSGVTLFPWLEPSFRYTRIFHVPGFSQPGTNYGDYKDKSLDVKLRLLDEREFWPQIALGAQDVFGTDIFRAYYAVASKRFGDFDATLGYGQKRIDGAFGGLRYSPHALPDWSVVAEYDANDYARDHGADLSGAASYKKGPAVALEYRRKWYGLSLGAAHGEPVVNAFISVPLDEKEWVPKVDEPPPYTKINPRPTEAQWLSDPVHRERLQRALYEQDFRRVKLAYAYGVLSAELTNIRISSMPRAVGRAARTLLSFAPLETREIKVTYTLDRLPLATYDFTDAQMLQRYFNGFTSREKLAPYVTIEYAAPDAKRSAAADREETLAAFEEPIPEHLLVQTGVEGNYFSLRAENFLGGTFYLHPGVEGYFNDPSGAFKLDVSAIASTEHWLGPRTQILSDWKATVWENVSDVTQPSNSELPHVRSDVAEYKRGGKFKILRLVANQYFQPARQWYARASAGIYEEMYDGVGGQVLYLPTSGAWASDVAVDWVKQRDFRGFFGTRDYDTVTAIASLNYRLAQGVTLTGRAGRFLAKDEGVRFEAKRRFASGVEVGAWYTFTNGHDITSPGSPSNPYHDKGIMMSIPLSPMLTKDTAAVSGFHIAPWTRDVGQMVVSPADLYQLTERSVVQMHELDGLSNLGDRPDDYGLPSLGTGPGERRWPDFVFDDAEAVGTTGKRIDWGRALLFGGGLTLASGLADRHAFDWAERHKDSRALKDFVKFGDALPLVALGASGVFAFDTSRPELSDASIAALEASAVGLLGSEALKYGVGRARPTAGLGTTEFKPGSTEDRYHSFPSNHVVAMWAAVTPYAEEFGMPWLYGAAALTNLARIGSREHWVSDTVGGAVLGYSLGYLTWNARREARLAKNAPQVLVSPNSVNLAWKLD